MSSRRPVVFLERDRVLVEPVFDEALRRRRAPEHPDELVLTRWAAMVLRQLASMGYLCLAVANASAREGKRGEGSVDPARPSPSPCSSPPPLRTARLHRRLQEDLGKFGARLDGIWDARGGHAPAAVISATDDAGAGRTEHDRGTNEPPPGGAFARGPLLLSQVLLQAIDVHRIDANRSAVVATSAPLLAAGRDVGAYTIRLCTRRPDAPVAPELAIDPATADFVVDSLQQVPALAARLRGLPMQRRR